MSRRKTYRKARKANLNREFARTAKRTRKINVKPRIMRGGIRL